MTNGLLTGGFSLIHISIRTEPLCTTSGHSSVIFSVAAILRSFCLKYIPPLFLEKVMHHSHVIWVIGIQERHWVDNVWTELQAKSSWLFTHLMLWWFRAPAKPTSSCRNLSLCTWWLMVTKAIQDAGILHRLTFALQCLLFPI